MQQNQRNCNVSQNFMMQLKNLSTPVTPVNNQLISKVLQKSMLKQEKLK
jgi:hypothetical protein